MGENKETTNVSPSILEEILEETFQKLEENEDFDSELILKLKNLVSEGTILNEKKLISILKGDLP